MAGDVPVEYLRECLSYSPESGQFRWLVRPERHFASRRSCNSANAKFAGKKAGHWDRASGYQVIGLTFQGKQRLFLAHRVAIALTDGAWPDLTVDHVNGRKLDNRRVNLRVCSHEQNMRNQGGKSSGRNPLKGAYFHRRSGKWQSSICVNYRQIHLGYFDTAEAAHRAYCVASADHHGSFGNFG